MQALKALWIACLLLLVLVIAPASWTEPLNGGPSGTALQIPGTRKDHPDPDEEERIKILKEMEKKANKERQAQLQRDTDKLLQLATELKEYVDKTNENVMSLEVLKKSEEIEKLAHSVKEKMRAN